MTASAGPTYSEKLEADLISSVRAGQPLMGRPNLADAATEEGWAAENTIRATELRHLLVDQDADVHATGVHLEAVRITGPLDLNAVRLRRPLRLERCYLDSGTPVNLDYAKISFLAITECHLVGLSCNRLVVTKGLELNGSRLTGPATGNALYADGLKVSGNVILNELDAQGVWLGDADIDGVLNFSGAKLTAAPGDKFALWADGLKLTGNLLLKRCTVQGGAVRLSAAEIGGELLREGARLLGDDHGCSGNGSALRANRMRVGSNVNLHEGFYACGTVSLRYTNVGGSLRIGFAPAKDTSGTSMKTPLDATGTQIAQELDWKPVGPDTGAVNLEQTTVGRLVDSWANGRLNGYWPTKGQLRLDGLTYGRICHLHDANKRDAKIRLEWIRSQYQDADPDNPVRFATQPYEQLSGIYLQAGRDADARRVAIARRQDLREYGKISNSLRFGNWLLDVTIKYGYRTWRAAIYLAVVYLLVVLFFSFAGHHDAVIPTQAPGGQPAATSVTARQCTGDYPCFNPWGYAIDTVIPIINVHQADYWSPDATVPWGRAAVWVTYLGTAIGWLLSALAVAGYTGLVRSSGAP